jgi:hypothetical protein
MDAVDPQLLQRFAEEYRVPGGAVLEARRRIRLAEVGEVEGHGAQAGSRGGGGEPLPIVGRARIAVDEDDRLAAVRRTRLQQPRPRRADRDPRALDRAAHRARAWRALTAIARGIMVANMRAGPALRVPKVMNSLAIFGSRAAAANSARSGGCIRRPVA